MRDTEIIERIIAGDRRAYRLLVERHQARAMVLALRMLGNRQDAEEALQDAFVRAFRGLDSFQGGSTFATWLYRIVYNVCSTALRRRGEVLHDSLDTVGAWQAQVVPTDELPDARLEGAEFEQIVNMEIAALPAVYRGVFTMFVVQQMSYEDIAEITGVPLNTVKTRLFRARTALRAGIARRMAVPAVPPAVVPEEVDNRRPKS